MKERHTLEDLSADQIREYRADFNRAGKKQPVP
jgi:hypothetical protein